MMEMKWMRLAAENSEYHFETSQKREKKQRETLDENC